MESPKPPSDDRIKRIEARLLAVEADSKIHQSHIDRQGPVCKMHATMVQTHGEQMNDIRERLNKMALAIAVSAVKQGLVMAGVTIVCSGVVSGLMVWFFRTTKG